MSVEKLNAQKTARQLAKEELQAENTRVAVSKLKDKMRELEKAQLVVKNLERELEDLEEQLAQGDTEA